MPVTGFNHLPFHERPVNSGRSDSRVQDIHGPSGYGSKFILFPSTRLNVKGRPYKVLEGPSLGGEGACV